MESVMVVLIVGVGFTGLAYLATLPVNTTPITTKPSTGELAFTLGYLILTQDLLVFKPSPRNENFLKEKLISIPFKLPVFVLIPLAVLRLVWIASWGDLGFSLGDVNGQLIAVAILIPLFGGFNFIAGSGAVRSAKANFPAGGSHLG